MARAAFTSLAVLTRLTLLTNFSLFAGLAGFSGFTRFACLGGFAVGMLLRLAGFVARILARFLALTAFGAFTLAVVATTTAAAISSAFTATLA